MRKKVTLNKNEQKGIMVVAFKNDVKNKERVTKSVGSDEEKAKKSQVNIEEIINKNDCDSFEGYIEVLKEYPLEDVRVVYGDSKYEILFTERLVRDFYEAQIPIYSKCNNDIEYLADACMLAGTTGVGKTKLLQQIIGSAEYNTPASTLSNTTTGSTRVYSIRDYKKLEMIYEEINESKLKEKIQKNILHAFKNIMIEGKEQKVDNIINNLLVSTDLRCNLSHLISDHAEIIKIANEIQEITLRYYLIIINKLEQEKKETSLGEKKEFSYEEKLKLIDDIIHCINSETDELEFDITLDLAKKIQNSFKVNYYTKLLYSIVKYNKNKLFKELFKEFKRAIEEISNIKILIKSINKTLVNNNGDLSFREIVHEFSSGEEFVIDKEHYECSSFYIEVKYSNNQNVDNVLRETFFKIMRKISCVEEGVKSLFPLVNSLTIKGDFKSAITLNNEKDFILVDSEGFGHDAANMEINREFIQNLKLAKKILWLVASDRPISQTEKQSLELFANNGVLYKTCTVLTKADKILDNNENIEERITNILNNLFKEFDKNFDIVASKKSILSKMLVIGDADKLITEDKIVILFRGKVMKDDINKEFEDNFKRLLDFKTFELNDTLKLEYSLIDFGKAFDEVIIKFLKKYRSKIFGEHWSRVKAASDRIGYNYNNRGYSDITPEADLKLSLKQALLKILITPNNLDKKQIQDNFDTLQIIQEKVSSQIESKVEFYILRAGLLDPEDNEVKSGAKWRTIYGYSGKGSGNDRKVAFVNLLNNALEIDRSKNKENVILRDTVRYIDKELKDILGKNIAVEIKSIL